MAATGAGGLAASLNCGQGFSVPQRFVFRASKATRKTVDGFPQVATCPIEPGDLVRHWQTGKLMAVEAILETGIYCRWVEIDDLVTHFRIFQVEELVVMAHV